MPVPGENTPHIEVPLPPNASAKFSGSKHASALAHLDTSSSGLSQATSFQHLLQLRLFFRPQHDVHEINGFHVLPLRQHLRHRRNSTNNKNNREGNALGPVYLSWDKPTVHWFPLPDVYTCRSRLPANPTNRKLRTTASPETRAPDLARSFII